MATSVPIRSYAKANQELAESFIRYLEARAFSVHTIRSYQDTFTRFVDHSGARSILAINRQDVRGFLGTLVDKGLNGNSMQLHIAALKSFYKFIDLGGIGPRNPTFGLSRKRPARKVPRIFTIDEIEKLIDATRSPFERAIVETLYSTGVRVAELVKLRVENIDLDEHTILVKKGKGGKDRYVLFGRPAAKAIQDYIGERRAGYLFINPHLRPVTEMTIRRVLAIASRRAGIAHAHPLAIRRAFACHMLSGGGNIRAIQELLGHAYVSTTQLYTTLTATELKKIHQRCHPHEDGGRDEK